MPNDSHDPASTCVQDSGNPVLDSTVNFLMSRSKFTVDKAGIENLHGIFLKLAAKEPGGLKVRHGYSAIETPPPDESE